MKETQRYKDKLKDLLDDIDCENVEQWDDKLNNYSQLNEFDDIDRICWIINSCTHILNIRKITFRNYDNLQTWVAIYSWKEFNWTAYEICLEDDYLWYKQWVEQIVKDMIAFEELNKSFVLSPTKK